MEPKISIIIPVYNGSNYMRQAIDSALAQTYSNFEVIVVNDGSQDDGATEETAHSYGSRINYIRQENQGVAGALNTGIAHMQGEYFSWLSHDDVYSPHKLESQFKILKTLNNPQTVIYSGWISIDEQGRNIDFIAMPNLPPHFMLYYIFAGLLLHGCTLLVPLQAFKRHGLFNPALKTTQDYDMWFRLTPFYQFVLCGEMLVYGRSHEAQTSRILQDDKDNHLEREELYLRYLPLISKNYLLSLFAPETWPRHFIFCPIIWRARDYYGRC